MALDEAEIVVTPHALAPAMDGLRPSDIDFLRNGSFNLGFIALRRGAESLSLLDWWERRCLSHGFNDLGFGTFVDQKWIDLVPSYFESVHVLRHRGCNVAFWNLHERQLFEVNGSYRVNDVPLVFFHFSGVRADAPEVLSKHQTRHAIAPGSLLARLVSEYSASLLQMGHSSYSKLAYGFGRLDDGTRSPASCGVPRAAWGRANCTRSRPGPTCNGACGRAASHRLRRRKPRGRARSISIRRAARW